MTDTREILQLAAKAAGIQGEWDKSYASIVTRRDSHGIAWALWNPLDNIVDRARLEDALEIGCNWGEYYVLCVGTIRKDAKPLSFESLIPRGKVYYTETAGDKSKARSLATVRCAAEIGRAITQPAATSAPLPPEPPSKP